MKTSRIATAIAGSLLLAACATPPLRPDNAALQRELLTLSPAARLPAGEGRADLAAPLALDSVVRLAFARHPQVRAALARLDALQAERVQAGLIENPMLSLMALRPEGGGRFELEYGLMQSLFDLFTRSRRVAVADALARQGEAEALLQLLGIAQGARAALVEAWFAEQALALAKQQLAFEQAQARLATGEAARGIVSASAALSRQLPESRRAAAVAVAEQALASARARLAAALGLDSAVGLVLPAELLTPDLTGLDHAELQAWALQHRPELRMANAQLEQGQAQRRLEQGRLRATEPVAGVAGMRNAERMAAQGLAVETRLPLFDRGQARSALAESRVVEAGHQAEWVRRQVPLEVERSLAALVAARAAVQQAARQLQQRQRLEKLALRVYRAGGGDQGELGMARRQRLDAAQDELEARRESWARLFELEQATAREVAGAP